MDNAEKRNLPRTLFDVLEAVQLRSNVFEEVGGRQPYDSIQLQQTVVGHFNAIQKGGSKKNCLLNKSQNVHSLRTWLVEPISQR